MIRVHLQKLLAVSSFAFMFSLFPSEVLDHSMDGLEKKKTGVHKLSDKEKSILQNWIDTHYTKRDAPLPQELQDKHAVLQENLQNSRFLRLTDRTLWETFPEDLPIAQGWITPVEIIVSQGAVSEYPYCLTNSLTGSAIRAKRVEKLPKKSVSP